MTFKAKINGAFLISYEGQSAIDTTFIFTKYRIKLKSNQVNRIFLDPFLAKVVADNAEYEFDKILNKEDKRLFSIILKDRLNNLDKGIHHLEITTWNKIKANIIHHRYWIDREKEWFLKTLISTLIGFLFGLMGAYVGYKLGIQIGSKSIKAAQQEQILPKKQ